MSQTHAFIKYRYTNYTFEQKKNSNPSLGKGISEFNLWFKEIKNSVILPIWFIKIYIENCSIIQRDVVQSTM